MFVQLTNQASFDSMRVYVWSDGMGCPFNDFLTRLVEIDEKTAVFMVEHLKCIMRCGELSLESSSPIAEPMRLIHAGRVWLAYFLEGRGFFLCDQGLDEFLPDDRERVQARILQYNRAQLIYER